MKRTLLLLAACGFSTSIGLVWADGHEGEGPDPATPVELFACSYNEGKNYDDLLPVIDDFNKWADKQDVNDYSAWVLVPYYTSPDRDFDTIWLGASPSGVALGQAQDKWLATGGKVNEAFAEVSDCHTHANFAVLNFKEPPERDKPDNIVITFSDCNVAEDASFNELVPAMMEWGKYREGHGSTAGIMAHMPAFGGGGETFDFKWVTAYQNLEDLGADYDQYSESGWQKANELFAGNVSCDSSRVYLATNHRRGEEPEE